MKEAFFLTDLGSPSVMTVVDNGRVMPYINIQVTSGLTREQKAELVRDFTATLQRVLGKKPEHTHIVIQEIADENWGYAGMLTDEWKSVQRISERQSSQGVLDLIAITKNP